MKATITEQKALLDLQTIDTHILVCRNKIANSSEKEQLLTVANKVAEAQSGLDKAKADKELVDVELRRSEVEVEAITDRKAKDQKVLDAGLVPAKELEQIQHEIKSLDKRQSELEEIELEIMERAEKADQEIARQSNDLDGLLVIEAELNKRLSEKNEALEKEIAVKLQERSELLPDIGAELIELYEKIREKSAGIGAARLVGNTCEGCRLSITAAELAKIKALPADELVRCEDCRRILIRI